MRASLTRATRLSADWILPQEWGEWAQSDRSDWTQEQVQRVAEQFRDYWLAKAGTDARKVDWHATWRNWVRREQSLSGATNLKTRGAGFGPHGFNKQAALEARNAEAGRLAEVMLFGKQGEPIDASQ